MIFAALPAINEFYFILLCLNCIKNQTYKDIELFVCVNQPESWWNIDEKKIICDNNQKTIELLNSFKDIKIKIIDKSSIGKGWSDKEAGVGIARKTIMDQISAVASDDDLIISIDADTTFSNNYFQSVLDIFKKDKNAFGLANPYYHLLTNDDTLNRAMLRYEIYMRYYNINLFRIKSPYNFTALGSAIACPVWVYKKIGGLTAKKSGEDFYFLQKIKKSGKLVTYNSEKVYPGTRYSDRVGFGTGPALIKGSNGDWNSYPVYNYIFFDEILYTYNNFKNIFLNNIDTPMTDFLKEQFKTSDLWNALRKNNKTEEKFIRACHEKVDGLRILQYLKFREKNNKESSENNFISFIKAFYKDKFDKYRDIFNSLSFNSTNVENLNEIRNLLVNIESEYQYANYIDEL